MCRHPASFAVKECTLRLVHTHMQKHKQTHKHKATNLDISKAWTGTTVKPKENWKRGEDTWIESTMTQQRTRSVRQRGSRKYCLEHKQWTFCTIQRCKKDIHIHILFPSSDISIQESTCIRAVRVYSFRLWEAQTLSYEVMCRTFRTTFWRARSARLAGPWDSVPLMVTPFSGVTNRAFRKNPKNVSCTVVASAKRISAASRHHIIHYMLPNVKNKRGKYSR